MRMRRGRGSVKENPKIQTPQRRRNHFINASFVREHGAGHGQDIAIRHMRPTWARGECDCPTLLHCHLPPLLTNGSCLHAGHETLRETCHQGWNNVWQSWKSWLFFARRLRKWERERRGVFGRFMQSVSSTLNNDFYRCPCRRRAAMPSGQVYELFLSFLHLLLLLLRCRHRSSTLWLLSQSYAGSLSCYTV